MRRSSCWPPSRRATSRRTCRWPTSTTSSAATPTPSGTTSPRSTPDVVGGHNNYGFLLSERLDRLDEAEAQYRLAIAAGDTEEALGNLAQLLEETGRTEEAEQHYRLAVAAGDEDARDYLAELLEDQGRDDEAATLRQG